MKVSRIKQTVRARDGYCCTNCGTTQVDHLREHGTILHVHRTVPGEPYRVESCVTLCRFCHNHLPRTSPFKGHVVTTATPRIKHGTVKVDREVRPLVAEAADAHRPKLNSQDWISLILFANAVKVLKDKAHIHPSTERCLQKYGITVDEALALAGD